MSVAVVIYLPKDVYRDLAIRATTLDTQVHTLVEHAVIRSVRPKPVRRKVDKETFWSDLEDPRHGTLNGYVNLRCRCSGCRTAKAEYVRDRKRATA